MVLMVVVVGVQRISSSNGKTKTQRKTKDAEVRNNLQTKECGGGFLVQDSGFHRGSMNREHMEAGRGIPTNKRQIKRRKKFSVIDMNKHFA